MGGKRRYMGVIKHGSAVDVLTCYLAATDNMAYNKNVLQVLLSMVVLNPLTSAIGDSVSKCMK